MISPETSATQAEAALTEDSVTAGVYPTHSEAFARALVVLAMGEACWIIPDEENRHHLRVEPAVVDAVREQLAHYDRESAGWPPQPTPHHAPTLRHAPLSPLVWVLGIFAIYWAQGRWPGLADATLLDADRVFAHGEWWRAATALWLHADLGHLVSNAVGGLLVFSAVITTIGLRASWWLIFASAVAGNLAAVASYHGEPYRSLGASTAVFAGLGLLTGRAVRVMADSKHPRRLRAMLVPLSAGLAVLGLFGAGGVNIDVLAHATGFASGLVAGFIAFTARPGGVDCDHATSKLR